MSVGTDGRGMRVIGAGCADATSDWPSPRTSSREEHFFPWIFVLFSRSEAVLVVSGVLGSGEWTSGFWQLKATFEVLLLMVLWMREKMVSACCVSKTNVPGPESQRLPASMVKVGWEVNTKNSNTASHGPEALPQPWSPYPIFSISPQQFVRPLSQCVLLVRVSKLQSL